jgi:hypothetical protein
MITYQQSTGKLWINNVLQGMGYSGHGPGLNNPAQENVKGVGPLPRGLWRLGAWSDHPHLGPIVSALKPIKLTASYGRSDFFIHGDNALMNHTGSDGCIVLSRALRQALRASGETQLTVIE